MPYQVLIKQSAEKELNALEKNVRERIVRRLMHLKEAPHAPGVKKLQGEAAYRLRVGDYRVLYMIDDGDKQVTIYAIGHRREVYR